MPSPAQSNSRDGETRVVSARQAADEGNWEEAILEFNQALAENPLWDKDPDFKHDRAIALFHLGKQAKALSELNDAVSLQPDYGYRYAARAWMKQALKDIHGAIADYQSAIALDPEDAISLNNLGLLEEQLGYFKEAKERFAAADELSEILDEESIVPSSSVPKNIDSSSSSKETTHAESPSLFREVKRAMKDADGRKEFIAFIRNGFKL